MNETRHAGLADRLRESVLRGAGVTDPTLRAAVEAHAARLSGRQAANADGAGVPPELIAFVEKVTRHAYRVTAEDVAALRRAGHSEDAIFEIAASAAVGAGMGRLERGLAALRGEV